MLRDLRDQNKIELKKDDKVFFEYEHCIGRSRFKRYKEAIVLYAPSICVTNSRQRYCKFKIHIKGNKQPRWAWGYELCVER